MDDEELRRKLEQVHDDIANIDHVDERGRAILRDVDGHIRELLAVPETSEVPHQAGLNRGLENAIRHFEVTHPTLTEALSDLLTALSNAGI
ncbi:MAG: DUF4404 family protein [Anaerolineae bacterium]